MRLHRFYTGPELELRQQFWLHDADVLHQWMKVLRFQSGQEVLLFDGLWHERLYRIVQIGPEGAHLELVTEFLRKTPKREVYLLWSLLKKDKNDWVLQKATELGVSHFWPLLAERSEKRGFNIDRAQKIIIEAAEQCGRSDIPLLREPMRLSTATEELTGKATLYACEQGNQLPDSTTAPTDTVGVMVGPEGGWTDDEKSLFTEQASVQAIGLSDFTLRAETASVVAVAKLIQ